MPGILDQTALQQRADRRRHVGGKRLPRRFQAHDRAEHFGHVLAVERASSRQHLKQHDAEGPDVRALVDLLAWLAPTFM